MHCKVMLMNTPAGILRMSGAGVNRMALHFRTSHFRVVAAAAGAALLLPVLTAAASPAGRETSGPAKSGQHDWAAVSDVHFTPFTGASTKTVDTLAVTPPSQWGKVLAKVSKVPSGYGSETNYALLTSALGSMRKSVKKPPVVVISGDFLAHDFHKLYDSLASDHSKKAYRAFVARTVAFLASAFGKAFPKSQFVAAPGNNDSVCGDYETSLDDPFLKSFAVAWKHLVDRHGSAPGFAKTFARRGAYEARLPGGSRAVVVNSVFWSRNYQNKCGKPGQHPAANQLKWLAKEASHLPANGRNWLVTHIPPGIDVPGSEHTPQPVGFFRPADQAGLLKILGDGRWGLEVTGHIHMSTYRLAKHTPVMVVPAITPVFSNNPAYYKLLVTKTGRVANYTAYAFSEKKHVWSREYSFNQAYGLTGFTAASLIKLQHKLSVEEKLRARYMRFYNSGSGKGGITPANFRRFWCASLALTVPAYNACLKHAH